MEQDGDCHEEGHTHQCHRIACIELLGAFLKKIEPTVSVINWEEATLADFEEFTQSFEADSDSFDAETAAAG